jgi:hypothetical protein
MKLPSMEHKFSIQVTGEESKQVFTGDFIFRRPTLRERAMIDVMKARLCGDLITIDPETRAFNNAMAHLKFTLKEVPDWWKDSDYGHNLYDANVILEVHNKCVEFEAEWQGKVYGKVQESSVVSEEQGT